MLAQAVKMLVEAVLPDNDSDVEVVRVLLKAEECL